MPAGGFPVVLGDEADRGHVMSYPETIRMGMSRNLDGSPTIPKADVATLSKGQPVARTQNPMFFL
jgi:hypothetical protein